MKYVSLILILFAMKLSWGMAYCENSLPTYLHVDLQNEIQTYISEYITNNAPEARDLIFSNVWTETVKENKIKAHFSYSFTNDDTESGALRVALDGYAVLNQIKKPGEEKYDFWSFDELFILNDHIEFDEGITIKADRPNE